MLGVRRAPLWTEAVFHVLAHVDVGGPASCHDGAYIAWAREHLGPAEERALGEDVAILAGLLASQDLLARVQILAWLWQDDAHVRAAAARDLQELVAYDVASPSALAATRDLGPPVEVLRAAAELELPRLRALGSSKLDETALHGALEGVTRAAPWLSKMEIGAARPLPRRGRVVDASIVIGVPGIAGAELEHVVWQAAHEATVVEVEHSPTWLGGRAPTFDDVERTALGLLRSRAARAQLFDAHARWLATLDLGALGPIPDIEDHAE